MLRYKGYSGEVEVDFEAGILHGRVLDMRDVITFQGKTPKETEHAFQDSIDDYLTFCRERGEPPEKPFSGHFMVRISPDLHRRITVQASRSGSLNQWVIAAFEAYALSSEQGAVGRITETAGVPVRKPGDLAGSAGRKRSDRTLPH